MKRIVNIICMITACNAMASVPSFEWPVDSQKPAYTWTIKTYAGTTPRLVVDLMEGGTNWFPSSDWSGFFWYGTNSDWTATNIVQIAGAFSSTSYKAVFQAQSTSFPTTGTFYGGVVMSNSTQAIEWGRGYVQVLPSGGITASGLLDLRGNTTMQMGGDVSGPSSNATVVALRGRSISTSTPNVGDVYSYDGTNWTPSAPSVGVLDHAALSNLDYAVAGHTGFATAAQGVSATNAQAIAQNTASLAYLNDGSETVLYIQETVTTNIVVTPYGGGSLTPDVSGTYYFAGGQGTNRSWTNGSYSSLYAPYGEGAAWKISTYPALEHEWVGPGSTIEPTNALYYSPAVGASGEAAVRFALTTNTMAVTSSYLAATRSSATNAETQAFFKDGSRPATSNWNLAGYCLTNVGNVQFQLRDLPTVSVEGDVYWSTNDHTISIVSDDTNTILQVGQESWIRLVNKTDGIITNGQVVAITNFAGNRNCCVLAGDLLAIDATHAHPVAIATHNVAKNAEGIFTSFGLVRDLDTSAYNEGDPIYLSITNGLFTKDPTGLGIVSPHPLGFIANKHANQGSIFVTIARDEHDPWFEAWATTNTVGITATNALAQAQTAQSGLDIVTTNCVKRVPASGGVTNVAMIDGNGYLVDSLYPISMQADPLTVAVRDGFGDIYGHPIGSGALITNLNASELKSGTVPLVRLPAQVLTNFDDTIHGQRGGSNLHAAANSVDAGFLASSGYIRLTNTLVNGGPVSSWVAAYSNMFSPYTNTISFGMTNSYSTNFTAASTLFYPGQALMSRLYLANTNGWTLPGSYSQIIQLVVWSSSARTCDTLIERVDMVMSGQVLSSNAAPGDTIIYVGDTTPFSAYQELFIGGSSNDIVSVKSIDSAKKMTLNCPLVGTHTSNDVVSISRPTSWGFRYDAGGFGIYGQINCTNVINAEYQFQTRR